MSIDSVSTWTILTDTSGCPGLKKIEVRSDLLFLQLSPFPYGTEFLNLRNGRSVFRQQQPVLQSGNLGSLVECGSGMSMIQWNHEKVAIFRVEKINKYVFCHAKDRERLKLKWT